MARVFRHIVVCSLVGLVVATMPIALGAKDESTESKDTKIKRAMSAAPASISKDATILDVDGTELQAGTNGWTCMPGIMPGDTHPMCNDATWMQLMQAVAAKGDFQTDQLGTSYMLQGDAHVSNTNPFATDPKNGDVWVQEGPHLMVIVPDRKLLEGVSDDPYNGGPYVMWKDTPYVHIMVPLGPNHE